MVFIWNDDTPLLIAEDEHFDQNQYVIASKVFLRFTGHIKNKGEQWIRHVVKSTSTEIESIEIFDEDDYDWAYVTYADSNDAHRAIQNAEESDEIATALPADTWAQPISFCHSEPDAQTLVDALSQFETTMLADESKIVEFALKELILLSSRSESTRVQEALSRVLPLVKKFEFQITDEQGTAISLSEFRSILQCIGKHVSELAVTFHCDKYPKYVDRYYQKMCQYVERQLKTLKLVGLPPNQDWLVGLVPLLGRVEHLTLQASSGDYEYDIDFDLHCPNLRRLQLAMNFKGHLWNKRQPNLEELVMLPNENMDENSVLDMTKNNPQLVFLEIKANEGRDLLKEIPVQLPNLETLCLHERSPSITIDDLEHLAVMEKLKSLEVTCVPNENFDGMNCLPQFPRLETLKLIVRDGPHDIALKNVNFTAKLAEDVAQLKQFHLRDCRLNAETLEKFIRNGKNLEVFTIRNCGLEITDTILETIETIRKADGYTKMVLFADDIHPELNGEKIYSTVTLDWFENYEEFV